MNHAINKSERIQQANFQQPYCFIGAREGDSNLGLVSRTMGKNHKTQCCNHLRLLNIRSNGQPWATPFESAGGAGKTTSLNGVWLHREKGNAGIQQLPKLRTSIPIAAP
jgi:hypothetical protein